MLIVTLLALFSCATFPRVQPQQDEGPVRLVVLVSVDQMIPEQMERLAPWFSGGFLRFTRGQIWRRAAHAHAATETGPGHATLGTGVHPRRSGIVGNGWLVPETGEAVYCVGDPDAEALSSDGPAGKAGSSSPANLLVPGLADHLRAVFPASKSVGISGKDRSAILATGQRADWALWWDPSGKGFVSSTYYGRELPGWVVDWNAAWADGLSGYVWEDLLPDDIGRSGTERDDRPGERGPTFPHAAPAVGNSPSPGELASLARYAYGSPLIDRFVIDLARRAVVEMDLGGDEAVDYLFVGLSACDTVGHAYGPYSREVTDLLLRTDGELETLFGLLDERLGADGWVAALSSDHGVLPLPESLAPLGFASRRVSTRGLRDVESELRALLEETFGADYLVRFDAEGLLFADQRARADGVDPEDVHRLAAEVVLAGVDWIERAVTRAELLAALEDGRETDPLLEVLARSFHPARSPDVVLVHQPWILLSGAGTTHGSPWPYDRDVPLAFIGAATPREERFEPCWTVDLVPTLLFRAGVPVPDGLDGTALE